MGPNPKKIKMNEDPRSIPLRLILSPTRVTVHPLDRKTCNTFEVRTFRSSTFLKKKRKMGICGCCEG